MESDAGAFDRYEAAGWELVAGAYARAWSPFTEQAVDQLLDAAGVRRGLRVLDVGTGAGGAAARATERGALATGVDAAAAMVGIAARRHPATAFVQASVTDLPFADESFDAAVGNIVIQHVGEPERAARELARVLVRGARLALSTWDAPERSAFFGTLLGAIADAEVGPPRDVPAGPSFFQFSDEAAFAGLLGDAGFVEVSVATLSVECQFDSAAHLVTALADGTVRTGALVRAVDGAQRRVMLDSLTARLEPWRRGNRYVVPAPLRIASARRPA